MVACPYLRLEIRGALREPGDAPSEDHRCVAIAGPRVLSRQQQQLVCLSATHVDCPRYRRAVAGPPSTARRPVGIPAIPRAIAAALVVLGLSAAISFGFVLQRGGIDLPSAGVSSGSAAAVAASVAPSSTLAATQGATPAATGRASATAAPTPTATRSPKPKPTPTPAPTLAPGPAASGGVPSADRLAVIKPCPGQAGCWTYKVRVGDNLWSIAHWFGVPLDTIYAWNPGLKQAGIQPGTVIRIPTPTR